MIKQTKLITDKPEHPVIRKSGYYVDAEPVPLDTEPQLLKQLVYFLGS
ncbi:hypothetical protein [Candidatus Coxiella mudrowiae]|nr:hypothetical protein [Candidatus Coxiella mudrowiae]